MARTPIHPGDILSDELAEIDMTSTRLTTALDVEAALVEGILAGRTPLSAEMALRLGRYFGMAPEFRVNLQMSYELDLARERLGSSIDRIVARAA